jgi:uncharacterized protein with gpF-like domain
MPLMKRLSQVARASGVGSARPLVSATLRKLKLSRPFQPSAAAVAAYDAAIEEKVAAIDRLPSKYRAEARELIWHYVMKGYDASGLARELSDRFGITPDRAKLIAQSQCKMARAVMANAERMQRGIREGVWLHNPRCGIRSHGALGGRRYELASGIPVEGKRAWPSNEAACLCSSIDVKGPEED